MKKLLFALLLSAPFMGRAQKVENIFVNLYTDSLKKGTYNYINVDGLLSDGRYIPLDSTQITFHASEGKFYGNTLWIDKDFKKEKVTIRVALSAKPSLYKEFTMYIKQKEDDEILKTAAEIINGDTGKASKKKKKK